MCRNNSFHPVEIFLENLPRFLAHDFALEALNDFSFLRVLGRLGVLVEDAEVAGEILARELVGREFVRDVVSFRNFVERAVFAGVGVERLKP